MAKTPERQDEQTAAPTTTTQEASLIEQVLAYTSIAPTDASYESARIGTQELIKHVLDKPPTERVSTRLVDEMITELDKQIGLQVDEVLHNDQFRQLESIWRSLKFLVDHSDFHKNIRIDILSVNKYDLQEDFADATEINTTGLYHHIYRQEYGQFGGRPYGVLIANFAFSPDNQDMLLLKQLAGVANMAHAPLVTSASPQFFGVEDFSELETIKDLDALFEGPRYTGWRSFRESEDARYVGLTIPNFILRLPYEKDSRAVKSFKYDERAAGKTEDYLWGSSAFALASRMTDAFAQYGWCTDIIGPQSGGAVEDLWVHQYKENGRPKTMVPTSVHFSELREFELSNHGFIGLTMRKNSDNAAFFSAASAHAPAYYGENPEDKQAETNDKLGSNLPYMFIISRLAHYIKTMQREHIGSWKSAGELQSELQKWINGYVSDQEGLSAKLRSRKPLKRAEIRVYDIAGRPGFFRVEMEVTPHIKYQGADFTLSLVGQLETKEEI